jgi:hypothetical protein
MMNRKQKVHEGVGPSVWDAVVADMREREAIGAKKYNKLLQAFDGRSSLVDVYQEILDAAVYLRKEILEREAVERGPEIAKKCSEKFGGHGVCQVVYTFHDDGQSEVAFMVGHQVDPYSWHQRGAGPSWDHAMKSSK